MTFYKDLYLSDDIRKESQKIIKKIKQNKKIPDIYVIALATVPGNLLDVIPAWELTQKGYPKDELEIIGMAKGKKMALEVTQSIVEEVYRATGDFQVRRYITERWEGQAWM